MRPRGGANSMFLCHIDLPESMEGLENAHVFYRLKAVIDRPRFAQNIVAKKVPPSFSYYAFEVDIDYYVIVACEDCQNPECWSFGVIADHGNPPHS